MTNLGRQIVRDQNASRHLLWKLSDLFFGPKRSIETKISKNSCLHRDIRFWPVFRRIMGGEKTQETVYTGPQTTSDNYYGSYKIICLGPKRLMITQSFGKKKQTFQ